MLRDDIRKYCEQFLEESSNVLFFLFSIREGISNSIILSDDVLFKLMKDKVISRNYIQNKVTLNIPFYSNDEGESFNVNNKIEDVLLEIRARVDEYRSLFRPIRSGNMGNKRICEDMLIRFILENDSSFDEVLNATLYYFHNTDPTYIMNAENFIYKVDREGKELSKLMASLEDIRMDVGSKNLLN